MRYPQPKYRRLAKNLAAALTAFWAVTAADGKVQLNRPSENRIEITGEGWQLRYGTQPEFKAQLVMTEQERAYFSHGNWLRLIDTSKGQAIGRWRFPGRILNIVPVGKQVQVEVDLQWSQWDESKTFRRTFTFDPNVPALPDWSVVQNLVPLPRIEAQAGAFELPHVAVRDRPVADPTFKIAGELARKLIPELEEASRRDPWSPWIRIMLGKLLLDSGNPQSTAMFHEAVRLATVDYTELLPISAFLRDLGEHEAARAAFETGYRDFLARGYDPRLNIGGRRTIFHALIRDNLSDELRREWIERFYRIAPGGEDAEVAWMLYAQYLERQGKIEEARLWRARVEEGRPLSWMRFTTMLDRALLIVLASIFAAVTYPLVLYARYRPQHRLALAQRRAARQGRSRSFLNVAYWIRSERVAFLTIALVGWFAAGVISGLFLVIFRIWATPDGFSSGKWAGPVVTWYLEHGVKPEAVEAEPHQWSRYVKLPVLRERDLVLAITYQQDGETEKAQRLYRTLPNFAESWNNLGVILKNAGQDQQARQAFEQALKIDPGLAEAELNLGRTPRGFWAQLHQQYLPGRPMIALPGRDRLSRLILGGSPTQFFLRAWSGPLPAWPIMSKLWTGGVLFFTAVTVFFVSLLALSIALLFLIPSRDVTQSPGKMQPLWESLSPGTSPGWRFCGGLTLLTWCYFIVQFVVSWTFWSGSPYMLTSMLSLSRGGLSGMYGVPANSQDVLELINPSWLWLYGAPALLLVVNLAVVRGRIFRRKADH